MKLGFVLATREDKDVRLLVRLGRVALDAGHDVRVFQMHEGVCADLRELVEAGADVAVCATNATARGLPGEGSQLDHAALVRECDRVVTLA